MEEPGGSVAQIITGALRADEVPDQVTSLVVGAMPITSEEAASPPAGPKRAYLKAITVEGFRGIGPKITLTLQPGRGLTVVTGRNGSGKSSFAEAVEFALTGENKRWFATLDGAQAGRRGRRRPAAARRSSSRCSSCG